MGLVLSVLPIVFVVIIGGAIVALALWVDEPEQAEPAEARVSQASRELIARPLVLFEPMVWTAELKRLPVEELVAKLEQELVVRRREAAELARALRCERSDPS